MEKVLVESVSGNIPEKKFSTGGLTATVWENQGKNKEGLDVSYRTVSFQRRYMDKNGEWQSTIYIFKDILIKNTRLRELASKKVLFPIMNLSLLDHLFFYLQKGIMALFHFLSLHP